MGWLSNLFSGKPQNGVGGEEPKAKNQVRTVDTLYENIVRDFSEYPSLIAHVVVSHVDPFSERSITKKLYLKLVDGVICPFTLDLSGVSFWGQQSFTRENMLTLIADDYSTYNQRVTLSLDFQISWIIPSSLPKVTESLVTNAIASAIPFTARQVFEGLYVSQKLSDSTARYYVKNTEGGYCDYITRDLPYWFTDLALSQDVLKLTEDPNKYVIVDEYCVDKNLLPTTHWKRWVEVGAAENNAKAALKYVPRDSGCGYVQYFDITFDFDDPITAGMAFNVGDMLAKAVTRLQHQLDKHIEDKTTQYHEGIVSYQLQKSRVSIEPERIKVIWQGKTFALEDYLAEQRVAETSLERPYFAGNQLTSSIDGNKFSIDAQYYINYTPWTPVK